MQLKCNKCGASKRSLFVEIQINRRGLYCGECGKWQKWITKQELQIAKFEGLCCACACRKSGLSGHRY